MVCICALQRLLQAVEGVPTWPPLPECAQQQVGNIQGQQHTWYCGAWTGYGFHEDGLKSGLAVAQQLLAAMPATLAEAA